MKKIKSSIVTICALSAMTNVHAGNVVTNDSKIVNQIIGDKEVKLQVLSEASLREAALKKSIIGVNDPIATSVLNKLPQGDAPALSIQRKDLHTKSMKRLLDKVTTEESLLVGLPIGLIGEQNVFGGVITQVTDKKNENLGTLKLTDLSPIHVRTVINRDGGGNPVITLVGCFSKCSEESAQEALINFPIVGFNQETGMIILDMSAIGRELDLISMLDPNGEYTQLKAISSATTNVEYDMKTLIFDIKTKMIPVNTDPTNTNITTTDFTVRWYMKLNSDANPAFVSRPATAGVGFFKTERGEETKITRFSTTGDGTNGPTVKYYIKNVPEEFKKSFSKAMDSWNIEFRKILGRDLLVYEFIDQDDSRSELLIPGDIRYNIIEWDLVNKATYGGLGPSIANQFSGQTMSANVLIQGPTIVSLYTKWFGVSKEATRLQNLGLAREANELIKDFNNSVRKEMAARSAQTFKLKLGKSLEMNIHAQREDLEDPIVKGDFDLVPAGLTYEKYMEGYMVEILGHEMGHNLGLRHNFKGNLGAIENSNEPGTVSRSIMEYLGRPYRNLNTIGPYDRMAIAYGYKGIKPTHLNWFCTDEDQALDVASMAIKSPECTKSDATSDPFSFWERRLDRSIELILETKSSSAPVWNVKEVSTQITEAVIGLSAYALSAEKTAETWTNFFGKNDRPENKSEIKNYVLARIKKKICNPLLKDVIRGKESADAQKLAETNLVELTKTVEATTVSLGLYNAADLKCDI